MGYIAFGFDFSLILPESKNRLKKYFSYFLKNLSELNYCYALIELDAYPSKQLHLLLELAHDKIGVKSLYRLSTNYSYFI